MIHKNILADLVSALARIALLERAHKETMMWLLTNENEGVRPDEYSVDESCRLMLQRLETETDVG